MCEVPENLEETIEMMCREYQLTSGQAYEIDAMFN
jgi:hypothetical protein